MTIMIDVPPEIEAGLIAAAAAGGLSADEYLRQFLMERFFEPGSAPAPLSSAARVLEKESGVWVLRTGQPIDPGMIDATVTSLRDERDFANLGTLR